MLSPLELILDNELSDFLDIKFDCDGSELLN